MKAMEINKGTECSDAGSAWPVEYVRSRIYKHGVQHLNYHRKSKCETMAIATEIITNGMNSYWDLHVIQLDSN